MNQIDERVGLQAVLTRRLSFSSGAVFFLEGEKKKDYLGFFTFVGSAFGISGSGVCVMDGFGWNGRWLKELLLWFYR